MQSYNDDLRWAQRFLVVLLALGGCFWGLMLAPWLFHADVTPLGIIIFGPGYLITMAYIVRSVCTPPLNVRRLIWVGSFVIQGAWLILGTWGMAEMVLNGQTLNETILLVLWWVFATYASVAGLLTERA